MLAQARADEDQRRRDERPGAAGPAAGASSNETWGAWATRQMNERTERLNIMGDSMNSVEQNSAGWAKDVNKYVNKQKKSMVMGVVKSKFGF